MPDDQVMRILLHRTLLL